MAKSNRRTKQAIDKTARKAKMIQASGESNYGRKRTYLNKHGGMGQDYLDPKPWKS